MMNKFEKSMKKIIKEWLMISGVICKHKSNFKNKNKTMEQAIMNIRKNKMQNLVKRFQILIKMLIIIQTKI